MKFIIIYQIILYHICSNVNGNYFCDQQRKDQLIDGLFNVNRNIYAFRKPYVWLIKDKSWKKLIEPILLSELFPGIPIDSFQSGISIINYTDNIDDMGNPFHPNGMTFLFRGNAYYVSKYANERKFVAITDADKENVPWYYTEYYGLVYQNMLIGGDINAAVYDHLAHVAYIVNDTSVTSFHLKANRQEPIKSIKNLPRNFFKGNGGIFDLDYSKRILYFANNNIWSYSDQFESLNKTYWQYFRCDKFIPPTTEIETEIETGIKPTKNQETGDHTTETNGDLVTEAANDSLPISNGIVARTPTNTTAEKFNCFRKLRCILLVVVFIVVCIFTIVTTITLCILYRNKKSKNKKNSKADAITDSSKPEHSNLNKSSQK